MAFDTHRIVKRLKEAGFNEAQAETFTEVLQESRALDIAELATKADLKTEIAALRTELKTEIAALRTELKIEIAAVRSELKTEIERAKNDMLKWIVPLILAQTAVMLGVLAKVI